jgi:signal peptidase I
MRNVTPGGRGLNASGLNGRGLNGRGLKRKPWYLFGVVFITLYLAFPVKLGVVVGDSMNPTLQAGDLYLMDRGYYRSHSVRQGDVVVFEHNGQTYLKRVLAAGGDTVYLVRQPGDDEAELVKDWQVSRMRKMQKHRSWRGVFRLTEQRLPENTCFVVGDNLSVSLDSRTFGPIPTTAIRGKVLLAPPAEPEMDQLARAVRLGRS